jgi:hypothetical protein
LLAKEQLMSQALKPEQQNMEDGEATFQAFAAKCLAICHPMPPA